MFGDSRGFFCQTAKCHPELPLHLLKFAPFCKNPQGILLSSGHHIMRKNYGYLVVGPSYHLFQELEGTKQGRAAEETHFLAMAAEAGPERFLPFHEPAPAQ